MTPIKTCFSHFSHSIFPQSRHFPLGRLTKHGLFPHRYIAATPMHYPSHPFPRTSILTCSRTKERFQSVATCLGIISDESFASLLENDPNKFQAHFPFIIKKLNSLKGTKPKFFDALSKAPYKIKEQIKIECPALWEQFEIYQKSGAMWECIHREQNPHGVGFIYTFRLNPTYENHDNFNIKQAEIYPAVEPSMHEISSNFNKTLQEEKLTEYIEYLNHYKADNKGFYDQDFISYYSEKIERQQTIIENFNFPNQLGYHFSEDGKTITLPDREALIDCYNQYREGNPSKDLPKLSLISDDGIASDEDFILANIFHHGVISEGKEFVHDHFAHILVLLQRANLGSERFQNLNKNMVSFYRSHLEKIEDATKQLGRNAPIFYTILGIYVDALSNAIDGVITPFDDSLIHRYNFQTILRNPSWRNYLRNRYNNPTKGPIFDEITLIKLNPLVEQKRQPYKRGPL